MSDLRVEIARSRPDRSVIISSLRSGSPVLNTLSSIAQNTRTCSGGR
jgi:hypothetical protein